MYNLRADPLFGKRKQAAPDEDAGFFGSGEANEHSLFDLSEPPPPYFGYRGATGFPMDPAGISHDRGSTADFAFERTQDPFFVARHYPFMALNPGNEQTNPFKSTLDREEDDWFHLQPETADIC